MVKDKPCKYLYKMILGKARGHDEKEETIYPFIVVCNLGIDELDNCPKKKLPLTITPHCWRIGLKLKG